MQNNSVAFSIEVITGVCECVLGGDIFSFFLYAIMKASKIMFKNFEEKMQVTKYKFYTHFTTFLCKI